MVADRTSINRELDGLINQQIHVFKQDARISQSELSEYQQRSQQIRILYRSLDQTGAQMWNRRFAESARQPGTRECPKLLRRVSP